MYKLFQTIKEEHEKPVEGTITGDIPDWVCGSLYRNGPGMYEVGEYKYNHIFDCLAMLTRFHIENKKVTYQNRYLNSETYKKNMAAQRIVIYGVGTLPIPDPCQNIFQRFLSYFTSDERSDNSIVNFFPLKDELYAATETNLIHKIDPDTLETLERVDLMDYVAVHSATAHPHYDADGTVHNIGHSFKGGPKICIIKIPPKTEKSDDFPKGQIMSAIKSSGKMSVNYLHSFGMTENYYVYVEQPMFLNLLKALTAKLRGALLINSVDWYPDIKTRFHVIDKRTGEEVNPDIKYEADPMMIFHHVNAYEDNGHVVMDMCTFNSQDALNSVYLEDLTSEQCEAHYRKNDAPEPRRYVLPLKIDQQTPMNKNLVEITQSAAKAEKISDDTVYCSHELLANTGMEFPQINYPRVNGKKYRYAYGVGWHPKEKHFHTRYDNTNEPRLEKSNIVGLRPPLIQMSMYIRAVSSGSMLFAYIICNNYKVMKIDINTKTFKEWSEDNCYPSEPVFVPNPTGTDEDDGVLLSSVNNSDFDKGKNSFLLVLDAKSMTEFARAEFDIPRFPKDFHGMFKTNQ